METILTNYPGIRKIVRFTLAKAPRDCELYAAGGQKVFCPHSRVDVPFFGVPVLTSTTKVENNGKISEAKLTLKTNEDLPLFGWCFAVELEDSRSFMLGTDTRIPLVSRGSTSGTPDGDPKVHSYEITMKGVYCPIECLM